MPRTIPNCIWSEIRSNKIPKPNLPNRNGQQETPIIITGGTGKKQRIIGRKWRKAKKLLNANKLL